jgi:exodeoxyribonuclease VII large subunit
LRPRLVRGLRQSVVLKNQQLRDRIERLLQASPLRGILRLQEKKFSLRHRLIEKNRSLLQLEKNRFNGLVKNLNALSPLTILDRGYSITTVAGKALKSSQEVSPGDSIQVRLSKGRLACTVDKVIDN